MIAVIRPRRMSQAQMSQIEDDQKLAAVSLSDEGLKRVEAS